MKWFRKKYKLPLWLFLFSRTDNPKRQAETIAKALKKGKPVICLKDNKPVKINLDGSIEEITDYTIVF